MESNPFISNIDLHSKTVFLTGVAGFIGANLARRLLEDYTDIKAIGNNSLDDYYDEGLKENRLILLFSQPNFVLTTKGRIADRESVNKLFTEYK